jgi:uncharacterized linocin/CFP29 family protein
MNDILRRSFAPITDEAWKEIDMQAARVLKGNLSARGLVDFNGPHGWALAAVNLGSVRVGSNEPIKGVSWGKRETQNLIELRAHFSLKMWELDNVSRGGRNPDLDPMVAAARKVAIFEETAVYQGFNDGGIKGICDASTHKPVSMAAGDPDGFTEAVEAAVIALQKSGVGGPYALVLGTDPYALVKVGDPQAYPLSKQVNVIADGGVFWSPALHGGVVLSRRGGDFELTVGQDLSIGFRSQDKESVDLFFTESFTFRVLEPAAACELKIKA